MGSNTATDHIGVLRDAVRQLPAAHRRRILIRIDVAGASHASPDWIASGDEHASFTCQHSTGFAMTEAQERAVARLEESVWKPSVRFAGWHIGPTADPGTGAMRRPAQARRVRLGKRPRLTNAPVSRGRQNSQRPALTSACGCTAPYI